MRPWPSGGRTLASCSRPRSGRRSTLDNCTQMVQEACRRAGVRVVRMHDFRHGCVSVLLGLGVPPRTVDGDRRPLALEMTMNVYGHVTLDDKRDALDRLERPVRGGEMRRRCSHVVAVIGRRSASGGSAPSGRRNDTKAQVRRVSAWAFGVARSEGFEPQTF